MKAASGVLASVHLVSGSEGPKLIWVRKKKRLVAFYKLLEYIHILFEELKQNLAMYCLCIYLYLVFLKVSVQRLPKQSLIQAQTCLASASLPTPAFGGSLYL